LNFLFAWRYFKAKKSTNAINIIAWVSVLAMVLITAAFVVMLSVFNGFEGLVKSLYSSFYSDLRIEPAVGKVIRVSPAQLAALRANGAIKAFSLQVEERALLLNEDIQATPLLKGVDSAYTSVTSVAAHVERGKFNLGTADTPGIVLGRGVEYALAVDAERSVYPLMLYLFRRGGNINVIDPYQAFSANPVYPSGTFYIQSDIDSKYAITNLAFMKRMMGMKSNEYSCIEMSLKRPEKATEVQQHLKAVFGKDYRILTRYEQNRSLYSVMHTEKWAIYGILTLMLVVAAFTMIGALSMLVMEKQKDIQVLKAVGASSRLVQRIFMSEGLLLAAIGGCSGLLLGWLICWAQIQFKLVSIQGGSFLIDYYPVKMVGTDFFIVIVTVMAVAILASWFPSRKAADQPVELRS
jgi:lipoprotein-releasing system permease protein